MLMKVVSRRSTIVATIITVVLASISATGVLAATGTGGSSQNNSSGAISQTEIRDVQEESTFFNNLQKQRTELSANASDRSQEQQWLQKYMFALAQAQAIIGGRFGITTVASTSGKSSTRTSSSGSTSSGTTTSSSTSTSGSSAAAGTTFTVSKYYQNNPDKLLAMYLHMMRQLRQKLGMLR